MAKISDKERILKAVREKQNVTYGGGQYFHRHQAILQSHSHQNSVVLISKQTDRPMEQNREPGNKP